jgi:6-phosphogluconate dehydrogenase
MLGGDQIAFEQALPILTAIAAPHGVQLFGPAGVGHYIKMIHNGIEYALLQAYGEGFELLKNGNYKNLNLALIADTWNHGSIIRSWLLSLSGEILKSDSSLESISGYIGENKTGQWAVQVAQENNISLKIIEKALEIRAWSRETGGDYSTKFVAMLRNKFGGHEVKKL